MYSPHITWFKAAIVLTLASIHLHIAGVSAHLSTIRRRGVSPSFTNEILGKRQEDDDNDDEDDNGGSGNVVDQWLEQNREWASNQSDEQFAEWDEGQNPKVMWIGCSDSRVSPEIILGLNLSDVFVHRNVGNIVHPYDDNLLGVLEYAVAELKIEHLIVAGHYRCGGVDSVLKGIEKTRMYVLDGWLTQLDLLKLDKADELTGLDEEQKWRKLAELNASDSAQILNRTKVVRDARSRGQTVNIYAMMYDVGNGLMTELERITE